MLQSVAVVPLVAGCFVYAAWTLLPRAAKKALATALLKRPLPAFVAAFLRRHANASAGCACDGCDAGRPPVDASATGKPITLHPRRRA